MEKLTRKLKTLDIHGKQYVEVKERILALVDNGAPYAIHTEHWYYPERKMWVVKATLTMVDTMESFTGLAQEIEDTSNINKTSALENAETSAVGRACAFAGIGVIDGIASVDEINKATNRESAYSGGEKKFATPPGQKELIEFIEEIRAEKDVNHIKTLVNQAGAIYKTEKQLAWITKEARQRTDSLKDSPGNELDDIF